MRSLRSRLLAGIGITVIVSVVATVVVGAVLTRSSLETEALQSLERQVELLAAQGRAAASTSGDQLGEFLATEQMRLAVLTPVQAAVLLPEGGATALRQGGQAAGDVKIRDTRFLYAARLEAGRAFVLLRSSKSQAADWRPFLVGLGAAGAAGALLAALVAVGLSRAVTRPLARIAQASRRLAAGDDPAALPTGGPTEVADLAHAFNHLTGELGRAQEAERQFLLSVSHELKTPLTAIRGHAEALADGVIASDQVAAVVEREAHRLERLVGDLLDLARLRRRAFDVNVTEVDLRAVAEDVVARHAPQAKTYGVRMSVAGPSPSPALGDADRLLQALSNLAENALRCTPAGGAIEISTAPGWVEVADTGPGLSSDDLPRAFERFYLFERYAAERPVGTGLGLALVQELIETMAGQITVSSEPSQGTRFLVTLPAGRR